MIRAEVSMLGSHWITLLSRFTDVLIAIRRLGAASIHLDLGHEVSNYRCMDVRVVYYHRPLWSRALGVVISRPRVTFQFVRVSRCIFSLTLTLVISVCNRCYRHHLSALGEERREANDIIS